MRFALLARFARPVLAALCCVLAQSPPPAIAGGPPDPPAAAENAAPSDQSIAKLVDSIRAAEKEFPNLETVVTKKRQWANQATPVKGRRHRGAAAIHLHETISARTVTQGDFFYSKMSIARTSTRLRNVTVERTIAFDGVTTRTVETGSAANVQQGKSVLVRPLPPQAWPLGIAVPLSDFLAGSTSTTAAQRLTVDSLVADNVLAPIAAVEPKIAGEETIKGVRCLRLEFQQEQLEDGERFLVRLWLAKDRQLIPARQQVLSDADNGPLLVSESHVDAWLELKPKVWLPKHITFVTYEPAPAKTRKESRRETFALEKANLDGKYPPEFFRDLKFPAELPVFTIKEGRLEGGFHKSEEPPDAEARLKEIAEQLRQEEARYNRLSVNASELRTTNPLFGDIGKTRTTKMHSLLFDQRAYTDARHETWRFDGTFRPMLWTEAYDGQYYRAYGRHPAGYMKGGYAWVCLQNLFTQGNTLVPVMLRPHSALVPGGTSYRRLADILWPAPGSVPPPFEKKVEYLGEAQAGQLKCELLSVRSAFARESPFKFLYWLAKDRNLIPVRFEEYRGDESLPVRLEIVDKFDEPSKGVWYPAHKTRYIFRQQIPPAVREGCLFVDQCWDYRVQSVSLEPEGPPGIFSQLVVDEAIEVQYFDKTGKLIAKIIQSEDSVPQIPAGN